MKPGGGKAKGASFERYVCRELSLWVSRGQRKDVFWRSAMSGGRSTVGFKGGDKLSAQAGDVSAIDDLGMNFIKKFVIECKHVKDLNIENVIKRNGALVQFWLVLCKEAARHGKLPFLVARQNNFPTLVATTRQGLVELGTFRVEAIYPQINMRIIFWDDFLKERPRKKRIRL
jgi:hypothetical protein